MRKYTLLPLSIIVSLMASFLAFAHTAVQEEGRIKKVTILNEPVEISGLRVNGQAVDFGQNFEVDEHWMDKVEVDVKNVTDKAILSLRLALYLRPNIPRELFVNFGFIHENRIAPGETVKISTDKELNARLKARVAESGIVTYDNHAEMIVDRVIFEDGTIWAVGTGWQRDPKDPKKLKRVSDPQKNISQMTGRIM